MVEGVWVRSRTVWGDIVAKVGVLGPMVRFLGSVKMGEIVTFTQTVRIDEDGVCITELQLRQFAHTQDMHIEPNSSAFSVLARY